MAMALSNIDIAALIAFHREHGKLATVTAVQPPARFGALEHRRRRRCGLFKEKPKGDGGWINGGFFVLSPKVIDYIEDDQHDLGTRADGAPGRDNKLHAYLHLGFWQPMDTLRDKHHAGRACGHWPRPWKIW